MIIRRKRIFKETGGRTDEWKKYKKKVSDLIEKRRRIYQDSQRLVLLCEDTAARDFFKQTKNYMSKQRPAPFDPVNMFPGHTEQQVEDLLAKHFNEISN